MISVFQFKNRREDITSTPCWIEIRFNAPLQWIENNTIINSKSRIKTTYKISILQFKNQKLFFFFSINTKSRKLKWIAVEEFLIRTIRFFSKKNEINSGLLNSTSTDNQIRLIRVIRHFITLKTNIKSKQEYFSIPYEFKKRKLNFALNEI